MLKTNENDGKILCILMDLVLILTFLRVLVIHHMKNSENHTILIKNSKLLSSPLRRLKLSAALGWIALSPICCIET